MHKYGLLVYGKDKLDYVFALTVEDFLERRLQTIVFKSGMAKSIHHARVLIRQRHIKSTSTSFCLTGIALTSKSNKKMILEKVCMLIMTLKK
ncbi:hypothetical protein LWI29_036144 [Acer saccharum]|uniref:RNA-binding S4 domain-containing protein n=1 Tax=Acer saccharum TaxID=4024 RepID=A0AA39S757_ACESA|nr:hypothetical protein LWI29_036144 [Acer saccharum]